MNTITGVFIGFFVEDALVERLVSEKDNRGLAAFD